MDIRIQLANHLLTRANVHPAALSLLCLLLEVKNLDNDDNYDDNEFTNYLDYLDELIANKPTPVDFDVRVELIQGLINNDKLNPIALKILISIINNTAQQYPTNFLNELKWQNYLYKLEVGELYDKYTGDE